VISHFLNGVLPVFGIGAIGFILGWRGIFDFKMAMALNKWLKPRVPDGCVIHSFRHSLRDRLRAIECPADIIDAIGGWTTEGIGHKYGQGHSLPVMDGWMEKLKKL
jgi:integrase|tara:strand:+ start:2396 stop:2713 length:318 start_codon:yes stop_codon:yes gene_type:complete